MDSQESVSVKSKADIQDWLDKKLEELDRPRNSVLILAVSKLQTTEKILQMHQTGYTDFGENYVQEALMKMEDLSEYPLRWHLIGHLQKNKVKQVVGVFDLIHSVDSVELAQKLNAEASSLGLRQKVLLQINQAEEKRKTGFQPETFARDWPILEKLTALEIGGLMCLPPLFDDPEQTRPYFRALREQLESLQKMTDRKIHPLDQLSMGTSHDYQIALEEGSTILRLGTILFGERVIETKGLL